MRRTVVVRDRDGWSRVQARPRKVRRTTFDKRKGFQPRRPVQKGKHCSSVLRLFGPPLVRRHASPLLPNQLVPSRPPIQQTARLSTSFPAVNSGTTCPLKPSPLLNFSLKSFKLALLNRSPPQTSPHHPMASVGGKRPRSSTSPDSSLPLPPDPSNPLWHGRCFNCSQPGHTRATCPDKGAFCTRCNKPGHQANTCRKASKPKPVVVQAAKAVADRLQPKGCLDEKKFPIGRPAAVIVFVPQGPGNLKEIQQLSSAVVVDA